MLYGIYFESAYLVSCMQSFFLLYRHDKKKHIDKAEVSDYEGEAAHCRDVCNTNSGIFIVH